jgi:hypothetical protein
LEASDIRYTPRVKFPGISGYDHVFDFAIPKSSRQPERILQAITTPSREKAQFFTHSWNDTRPTRSTECKAYEVLNDADQPVPGGVVEAFRSYQIQPVLWSGRVQVITELAAERLLF